jgi:hypothetical protein
MFRSSTKACLTPTGLPILPSSIRMYALLYLLPLVVWFWKSMR